MLTVEKVKNIIGFIQSVHAYGKYINLISTDNRYINKISNDNKYINILSPDNYITPSFSACDRSFVSTISPKSKNGTFTAPVSPRFMEKN